MADYVTVATLALPPPEDDWAEHLEKAEGVAVAVRAFAEVFVADPGGDPEVVHRFARMLLALEEFELAGLCPEQRLERQRRIERYRRLVAQDAWDQPISRAAEGPADMRPEAFGSVRAHHERLDRAARRDRAGWRQSGSSRDSKMRS